MNETFTPEESEIEKRLDVVIPLRFRELSRNQVQQLIKRGQILVNQKTAKPSYRLEGGETIAIQVDDAEYHQTLVSDASVEFSVIEETKDYIVIEKPAGLSVHPDRVGEESTLVHGLIARYPEIAEVGEDVLRPGIVHRLDRLASGVMVIARTQEMFEYLKSQWQARTVAKEYSALVIGHMPHEKDRIESYIRRSDRQRIKMVSDKTDERGGKLAITDYEVVQSWPDFQLLNVQILTGRTHQIRLHLASLGHPIVGDNLYTPRNFKVRDMGRFFLHARRLQFQDLAEKEVEYVSDLPKELQAVLDELKG